MAYAVIADVQNVLKDKLYRYPDEIDSEIEYAESRINSALAGHYDLKFDDPANYATVPVEIKWITSLLTAWRLWDQVTILEGQKDDTAAQRWHDEAMEWLDCLKAGACRLTLDDGTLISLPSTQSPRFYPGGVKDKADGDDNVPYFTRAQGQEHW